MAITKAQSKAVNKYVKNNYDRLELLMPKGKKEVIKSYAAAVDESLNGYIKKAVTNRIKAETGDNVELWSPAN